MKKFLYKIMEYKFIYRLMPKWTKFIYCFDAMMKNKSGYLHLGNGYSLNFETMSINDTENTRNIWDEYWIVFKNGVYVSGTDGFGYPTHTKDIKEAFKFYDYNTAMSYFNLGYNIIKTHRRGMENETERYI